MRLLQKRMIRQLKPAIPRISFHRMTKSPDFEELYRLYASGIGGMTLEQFIRLANQLERSFAASFASSDLTSLPEGLPGPAPTEITATPVN
ncbi:hypothetical protein [Paenibacillus sp. MBLB4367]|uniref:hypothetical protein n=1 Tax=Paenibacillus sp. MBLB4367 TaxID=3384767 RepID=UPI00390843DD